MHLFQVQASFCHGVGVVVVVVGQQLRCRIICNNVLFETTTRLIGLIHAKKVLLGYDITR